VSPSFTGRTFGRYRLIERIGAGAMGEVYRAHDDRLDRDVAVKVIHTGTVVDEDARRRLRREADTLSKLNHPNIATVYDFDSDAGVDFVVMELVAGETLGQRAMGGALDERELWRIGAQIASGLEEAHEHGVIHRDLKPGNVMLTPKGQVKLLDFGLAQRGLPLDTMAPTATASLSGTFPYMAPEQLRKQAVGPWTDVWALGAVLYELSTGRRPFGGDDLASTVEGILHHDPEPPSRINRLLSPSFEQVILKALSKPVADRYQTAAEMGAVLQTLQPGGVPRAAALPPVAAPPRRWSAVARWTAVAALLAGAVAAAGRFAWRTPRPPAPGMTVLVGGVENRTGNPIFDQMLPELLGTSLEQSHAISVYPQANLGYVLRRMQRDPATSIDEATGREICQREGLSAVVLQSITRLGSSLVLVVRAVLPDGRLIASTQQTLADPSELPRRVDAVGTALRGSFGESAASIAKASVPLADVTSQSLEAVRFFTLGKQRIYAGDPRGALVFMQKAVDLDPDFAMAHEGLGVAYQNLFDNERAEQHFREAAAHLSRAPEIEREKILGDFNMIRHNYDGACSHFEVLAALRPRDTGAFLSLGYCSARRLDSAKAMAATTKAYEMQPTARTRMNLSMVAFLSGDARKALDLAEAVRKEVPGLAQAGFVAGKAQIVLGRLDAARETYRRMVLAGGDSEVEGHAGLADLARSTGRRDEALRELEAQRTTAVQRQNQSAATSAGIGLAEMALADGSPSRAGEALARITPLPSDVLLLYRIGRAWARAGRSTEASAVLEKMDNDAPEHSRQFDALKAMLRAEIALGASDTGTAVQEAEAAVGFEPSTAALDTMARAYIAAKRWTDAVRPLEQILERPDERCESDDAPACYRVTEAEYWLGRVMDEGGDHEGAAPHLRKFAAMWAGATGQPMLEDAKRRLAAHP
jgi:tetratricopeptide (TPR) repeat protein/predicted Ser/Thr protein kinase